MKEVSQFEFLGWLKFWNNLIFIMWQNVYWLTYFDMTNHVYKISISRPSLSVSFIHIFVLKRRVYQYIAKFSDETYITQTEANLDLAEDFVEILIDIQYWRNFFKKSSIIQFHWFKLLVLNKISYIEKKRKKKEIWIYLSLPSHAEKIFLKYLTLLSNIICECTLVLHIIVFYANIYYFKSSLTPDDRYVLVF